MPNVSEICERGKDVLVGDDMFEELKKIIKRIKPKTDVDSITLDSRLVEDLSLDSLAIMMLAMDIEEYLGVYFEDDVPQFLTVRDVVAYLENKK